ncbi:MAG: type II toxin-antitoxin system Phd/YefM family antitoxin [Symploca sp. SIO3E6]|nr:type II toxin-antitoxin system Phd/YefM family antitoxin [Caldora sp. SIO3E6]
MKTIEVSEISSLMEKYDQTEQPLILTRNGQPVAALFPIEDVDLETLSLSTNPKFIRIIEESRKSQQEEGRIFLEDIQLPDNINHTDGEGEELIDEYTY